MEAGQLFGVISTGVGPGPGKVICLAAVRLGEREYLKGMPELLAPENGELAFVLGLFAVTTVAAAGLFQH